MGPVVGLRAIHVKAPSTGTAVRRTASGESAGLIHPPTSAMLDANKIALIIVAGVRQHTVVVAANRPLAAARPLLRRRCRLRTDFAVAQPCKPVSTRRLELAVPNMVIGMSSSPIYPVADLILASFGCSFANRQLLIY
jgi:hypothetical protein